MQKLLIIFLALLPFSTFADSYEYLSSEITINSNNSLLITDKVKANSSAKEILYGIVLDGPIKLDRNGTLQDITYKVNSVTRNDLSEPFFINTDANRNYLYIGEEGREIGAGIHEYNIQYEVKPAIAESPDADYFKWLPAGILRELEIGKVSAKIIFPDNLNTTQIKTNAVIIDLNKGPTDKELITTIKTNNSRAEFFIETKEALLPNETVEISAFIPKGYIKHPPLIQTGSTIKLNQIGNSIRPPDAVTEGDTVKVE